MNIDQEFPVLNIHQITDPESRFAVFLFFDSLASIEAGLTQDGLDAVFITVFRALFPRSQATEREHVLETVLFFFNSTAKDSTARVNSVEQKIDMSKEPWSQAYAKYLSLVRCAQYQKAA